MNVDILNTFTAELQDKLRATAHKNNIVRNVSFPNITNKIHVAIGMRRTGKTWLLLQTINKIMHEKQVPLERFLYLNFEDDRLLPCSQEKLRSLLECFYQQNPDNHQHLCYFFLDEIQNAEEWSTVIRRFFDTKNVRIYLSGSSAKLLSKEIATSLRGRSIATEVWPYSFTEYLEVQPISSKKSYPYSKEWYDHYMHALKQYLHIGGFPEIFETPEINRRQLLQDYVEVVIMRDLIERYQITNISLVKYLIGFLLKNTGCSFSINKLANDIKSQGITGSRNTLYDYLNYIEDAYLAFAVPIFSESIRKVHSNPRKIYTIDAGMVRAFSLSLQDNFGHLFENLVFLDFKRKNHKIYYYLTQERYEVDFLTEDPFGQRKLFQVVWDDTNPITMERERRALEAAKNELQLDGEIITPTIFLQKTEFS